jgi:hypothetical protein
MGARVQREPPEQASGPVAKPERGKRVCELVHREADQQHDRDHDDRRDELFVQRRGTSGPGGSRVS